MPDIRSLAPLLQVFDMPTSVRFYCDMLGFVLVAQSKEGDEFGWCLLRLGEIELMLNTAYDVGERPPAPDAGRVEAHRDTCLYLSCPDVDAAYRELSGKGLKLKPPAVAPYGMRQLHLSDPDGYAICLQWPA